VLLCSKQVKIIYIIFFLGGKLFVEAILSQLMGTDDLLQIFRQSRINDDDLNARLLEEISLELMANSSNSTRILRGLHKAKGVGFIVFFVDDRSTP
jgi:hypothetical protein